MDDKPGILVYDLEIKKAILGRNESPIPGIQYCAGWHDKVNMGISVLTAWSSITNRYYVYMDDNKADFQRAVDAHTLVGGHAILNFDNPVVLANWKITIPIAKSYDTQTALKAVMPVGVTGLSLDNIAAANFGYRKTESGAMAPVYWQRGELGRLIDYCMNDTFLTVKLIQLIQTQGSVVIPQVKTPLRPKKPFS